MKSRLFSSVLVLFASSSLATAAVNVPLTIQETLYPGSMPGLTRSGDPVTVGIPLPDDDVNGATDVSRLSLTGATVGQFRVLGRWPSGRIKWVLVDTQAGLSAGGRNTSIALTNAGSGNFGGASLATDNGATITVSTGAATFIIRKANFNGFDQVIVGGTTVVASGASQGLVVTGPAPGQTTCGNCSTPYSSANDPTSTAVIEENGPAKTVIMATGVHRDASGNPYMRFTVRIYFYRGKSYVKLTSSLRNADYGTSNSFETAYKGHQGYELRLSPRLSGSANYAFGNHTASPTAGTLSSADSVYLYQGESQSMKWQDWCGFGCVPFTLDSGYRVVRNGSTVMSGGNTEYPQGWADLRDGTGAGVSIGVYQMAAYWPKSLEFNAGGSDVRIGIWARQNSQPYYQAWPQWSTHDLYLNFHASALASPADEFLRFQHSLVARAPMEHYNSTKVFPYPLLDPVVEDGFYQSIGNEANPATVSASRFCCIQDVGTASPMWPLNIYRFYAWGAGGGANQMEFRWSFLLNFLTRGWTGRYLNSAHFYRFQADSTWPRSDGFNWRDKPGEYNGFGYPSAVSTNENMSFRNWRDQEHAHWYGMTDFYFMTGDELTREALLDGPKDWHLNNETYQNGKAGGLFNTRAIAGQLISAARYAQFLAAIGDSDAAAVLGQATNTYNVQVKPELCVSGFPAGCTLPANDGGNWTTQGVSRTRGVPWGASGTSGTWCGANHSYRVNSSFQPALMMQGLLEFRNAKGPGWSDYWESLDLAYGMARWNLQENYVDNGNGRWDQNGFRFGLALDVANNCPGQAPEPNFAPVATQTTWMTFLVKNLVEGSTDWAQKFKINIQKLAAGLGTTTSDFGGFQVATVLNILRGTGSPRLTEVPISSITTNGGGSYTISWTVPQDARSYRVKWGTKQIVDWVGFDPGNNVFTGDPVRTMPWFAAANAESIPSPGAAGTVQSLTINTGTSGLVASNFSVKAYVGGTSTAPGNPSPEPPTSPVLPPTPPSNLRIVLDTPPPANPAPPANGADVEWQRQPLTAGYPGYNGWLNLMFDPVSQSTLHYGILSTSTSIYSTDLFAYKSSSNAWTHISGTGTVSSTCPASTAGLPGDRHPYAQMAIDTKRNVMWLVGGVCGGIIRQDMYYLLLNADPTRNTWHQVSPAKYPMPMNSSAMVYDSDSDVLFLFGTDTSAQTHDNWVYCRTAENPTPGLLTSAQSAAGCASADNWTEVSVAGGIQPPGVQSHGMVYDTVTRRVIHFAGETGGGVAQNQVWTYNVPTRTWTRKGLQTTAPPLYTGPIAAYPAVAYNSLTHKMLYHQTSNGGAPADWQYDPVADTWTKLASAGTGPTSDLYMAYDASTNRLIGFSRNPNTGQPDVWIGVLR